MKYLVMALGVSVCGLGFAAVANCPVFALFMLPCMMFAGFMLYLEVKGKI